MTNLELFRVYELRSRVFVVEQNCAYQDPDREDLTALHVLYIDNDELLAYARIIPPAGVSSPRIGRVVTEPAKRKTGLGRSLMKYCLNLCSERFNSQDVIISAQCYLDRFYTSFGFTKEGEEYLEDGIPHQKMRLRFSDADAS